jgi:hypothetical protein
MRNLRRCWEGRDEAACFRCRRLRPTIGPVAPRRREKLNRGWTCRRRAHADFGSHRALCANLAAVGVNHRDQDEAEMNGRRRFFRTIGLGFLLVGGTAAAPGEESAVTAKPQPTSSPTAPEQRPQYKVLAVRAGDSIEDVLNAAASQGFQYAGSTQRYGQAEFIFVKWVPVEPITSGGAGDKSRWRTPRLVELIPSS